MFKNIYIKLILIIIIIFTNLQLFGDESIENRVNRKITSGSGSSIAKKRQIPKHEEKNYKLDDSLHYQTGQVDSINVTAISTRGYGNSKGINANTIFMEDNNNPGYPIGWITNSNKEILKKNDKGENYILLFGDNNIYLGKLINTTNSILISYLHNTEIVLEILKYDKDNNVIGNQKTFILPRGEFEDYKIDIETNNVTSHLYLKFIKKRNTNDFLLYNFKMGENYDK